METAVVVEKLEATRVGSKGAEGSPGTYSLNVALSEKERGVGSLVANFSFELNMPGAAKFVVAGRATLTGQEDEIRSAVRRTDEEPPAIVQTVYQKVYGLLYILTGSMKVPYPLPGLARAPMPEQTQQAQQ